MGRKSREPLSIRSGSVEGVDRGLWPRRLRQTQPRRRLQRCRVSFGIFPYTPLVCMLSFPYYRMPLQETLDTYSYFITEADKLNLAYFTLVRYQPSLDAEYDGTYFRRMNLPDSTLT